MPPRERGRGKGGEKKKSQLAESFFELSPTTVMFSFFSRMENVIIQSSLSALERPVILKHGELWLENIGQLCPFVSPGLLNES